jgi:hypothetical protein
LRFFKNTDNKEISAFTHIVWVVFASKIFYRIPLPLLSAFQFKTEGHGAAQLGQY